MRPLIKLSRRLRLLCGVPVTTTSTSTSFSISSWTYDRASLDVVDTRRCAFGDEIFRRPTLPNALVHRRGIGVTSVSAKSKDRGKDKKKHNTKHPIDFNEMSTVLDVDQLKQQCEQQVTTFKDNLVRHASLRPASAAIEELPVAYDGATFTLQELANVTRKSNVIVINVTDFPQAIPSILKSFVAHAQNLNPQQDGTTLYVTLPKVTTELRQAAIKVANATFQKFRGNMREIRNKYVKRLTRNDDNHPIDLIARVQENLELLLQEYIDQATEILKKKQKDLEGDA